jgi:hypothetical protein
MKYISQKDTNTIIRKALKAQFPGVKFRVAGSGGGATDIDWFDGPSDNAVYMFTRQFAGATFDGMIDLESTRYGTHEGETVVYGAKYVFTHRGVSDEAHAEIKALIKSWGVEGNAADYFETPVEVYVLKQGLSGRTGTPYEMTNMEMLVRYVAELTAMKNEQEKVAA